MNLISIDLSTAVKNILHSLIPKYIKNKHSIRIDNEYGFDEENNSVLRITVENVGSHAVSFRVKGIRPTDKKSIVRIISRRDSLYNYEENNLQKTEGFDYSWYTLNPYEVKEYTIPIQELIKRFKPDGSRKIHRIDISLKGGLSSEGQAWFLRGIPYKIARTIW